MEIHIRVAGHIGKYDRLLEIIKKNKLRGFGHEVRKKGTLANIILQGKAQMVWTCGEKEGNPGKHHLAG